MHILKYFDLSYIRMQKYFLLIYTYIMQRRILKMFNNSKFTVTVKCFIGAKGVQTSLMLQLLISVSGHLMPSAF